MATPKLVYFDFDSGRGEHIRLAFHIGGASFIDERVSFPQFTAEWKSTGKAPYGGLPVLVVGDKVYAQSNAILRYAAQIGNAHLYPSDPLVALFVDQLCDAWNELAASAPQDPDPTEKKKKREEWSKQGGNLHVALKRLEGELGSHAFSVSDQITIADLVIFATVKSVLTGGWDYVDTNTFAAYPNITKIYEAVASHPKVTEWYDQRKGKTA